MGNKRYTSTREGMLAGERLARTHNIRDASKMVSVLLGLLLAWLLIYILIKTLKG